MWADIKEFVAQATIWLVGVGLVTAAAYGLKSCSPQEKPMSPPEAIFYDNCVDDDGSVKNIFVIDKTTHLKFDCLALQKAVERKSP